MDGAARWIGPLTLAFATSAGCSIKTMAINSLADTLAASGDVYASDEDPELVRDAVPFSLKTVESLLVEVPRHPGLLLTACSGFTQYGYAFVQAQVERLETTDYEGSVAARERAVKMYLRARRYCLRRIALEREDFERALADDPKVALASFTIEDVPLLYWTGASWGGAVSAGSERPELIAALPSVRAILERALELDEAYSDGAIHEAFISLDALPEPMGGSPAGARRHFDRAVALSKGLAAGPYVTYASSVSVARQDRGEFQDLLDKALAIDVDRAPSRRLANILAQRRARWLLAHADDLFAPDEKPDTRDPRTREELQTAIVKGLVRRGGP
jgi:predicted anti-sigma-YlaC factor YlaD